MNETNVRDHNRFLNTLGWSFLFGYLGFHLCTLTKIQDVYGDEPAGMQTAMTLLKTGQVGSYSGRDIYSPPFSFLTNAFPYHVRPYASYYFAAFIKCFGPGVTTARFASWLAGGVGLVLFYVVALRFLGSVGAFAGVIVFMGDPIFGTCLHICREEPVLFGVQMLVAGLWAWAFDRRSFWLALASGCLMGLAPGIHPNAVVLIPAFCAMTLLTHESTRKWTLCVMGLLVGLCSGFTLWGISCAWDEFQLGWTTWGGFWGYGLPILSGKSLVEIMGAEVARYMHPAIIPQSSPTPYYRIALWVEYSAVALTLGATLWRAGKERVEAILLTGLFTTVFAMAMLVARKYSGYSMLTLPWMALLVGRLVASKPFDRSWRWGFIVVGSLFLALGTKAVADQAKTPLPYLRVCAELRKVIPPTSRVLGPGQFWLEMPGYDWRDSNFLIFEKWITNSSKHVAPALQRVRPDYVVADLPLQKLIAEALRRERSLHLQWVARVPDQEPGKELLVLRTQHPLDHPTK